MTESERKESPIAPDQPARTAPDVLLKEITACLDDHLAEDVVVIELAGKSTIADYMVVASGRSSRQVVALADHLLKLLKEHGVVGIRPEGARQGDWVLIDAGDIIIHLFRPEVREFYNLEKMWGVSIPESDRSSGASG